MNTQQHKDHILIVDDDAEIRQLLKIYLEKHGLRASTAESGIGMWSVLKQSSIDLIVLDLMMPGEDGLSLCRELRIDSYTPIIMLTALGEETDRIVGLEMGADDYLAKPFNPRELLARINSVLRRARRLPDSAAQSEPKGKLHFAGLILDTVARQLISAEGAVVPLSGGEYRLLRVFLDRPNRVLSRDQLLELVSGKEAVPYDRSIDVQVGRLRKRLGDDSREPRLIKTVRSAGYVFTADVEEQG
ncbi:Two-component transcriptional response regulator, LuxR family [hydrothermal vent metagenome]|uniref:Two-component transcriptional response regulator, LuxR family n=1 Tax=hydrothermal vent metagenome TaxID=652676 RepID=A0A3B1AGD4_9ZZZZ